MASGINIYFFRYLKELFWIFRKNFW